LGKHEEAERVEESALILWENSSTFKHSDVLQQMANLADTKASLRKFAEAEILLLKVIKERKVSDGSSSMQLAEDLTQLSDVKKSLFLFTDAEKFRKRFWRSKESIGAKTANSTSKPWPDSSIVSGSRNVRSRC
jgi:hypothetical protein